MHFFKNKIKKKKKDSVESFTIASRRLILDFLCFYWAVDDFFLGVSYARHYLLHELKATQVVERVCSNIYFLCQQKQELCFNV